MVSAELPTLVAGPMMAPVAVGDKVKDASGVRTILTAVDWEANTITLTYPDTSTATIDPADIGMQFRLRDQNL